MDGRRGVRPGGLQLFGGRPICGSAVREPSGGAVGQYADAPLGARFHGALLDQTRQPGRTEPVSVGHHALPFGGRLCRRAHVGHRQPR
ncbi:hypothetical protein [Streptomyces sp. NPDC090798]|uniref:hypothetical protein n=1 Tax=Streptomyces sp. NPDC090798 TaxID=3365968 RepID=UPI0038296E8F